MYLHEAIGRLTDEIHAAITDDELRSAPASCDPIDTAPEDVKSGVAEMRRLYDERYKQACLVYDKQEDGRHKQVSPEDYPPRPLMTGISWLHVRLVVLGHIRECWLNGLIVIRGREWTPQGHFLDDQDGHPGPAEDIKPHDDMHLHFEGADQRLCLYQQASKGDGRLEYPTAAWRELAISDADYAKLRRSIFRRSKAGRPSKEREIKEAFSTLENKGEIDTDAPMARLYRKIRLEITGSEDVSEGLGDGAIYNVISEPFKGLKALKASKPSS